MHSFFFKPANDSVDGVLNADITPATFCPFIDINNNDQLGRFGLHNGGSQDIRLLNEKWESLSLVPVDRSDKKGNQGEEYFLFVASDNDFITQKGKLLVPAHTWRAPLLT